MHPRVNTILGAGAIDRRPTRYTQLCHLCVTVTSQLTRNIDIQLEVTSSEVMVAHHAVKHTRDVMSRDSERNRRARK